MSTTNERSDLTIVRPLLIRAVVIWVLYEVANALGLRADMALLSGTIPTANESVAVVLCVVYLGLYLGAVFVAPILVLTAGIEAVVRGVGCGVERNG